MVFAFQFILFVGQKKSEWVLFWQNILAEYFKIIIIYGIFNLGDIWYIMLNSNGHCVCFHEPIIQYQGYTLASLTMDNLHFTLEDSK